MDWESKHFINYVRRNQCDGCIPYFLADSPKHSYMKYNYSTKQITQVAEKQVISNLATVGVYYWKSGSSYVRNAKRMIEKNVRFNNEFYICPVYNELIYGENGKVLPYPVYEMRGMGTPEELETFLELLKKDKSEE
jgi:dTDP-glucose pyrophosphorylase